MEGGKQGTSSKKVKKEKVAGAAAKAARTEGSVSAAPRVKPELSLPVMYFPNLLLYIHSRLISVLFFFFWVGFGGEGEGWRSEVGRSFWRMFVGVGRRVNLWDYACYLFWLSFCQIY